MFTIIDTEPDETDDSLMALVGNALYDIFIKYENDLIKDR